jgi:hypothetical protein
MSRAKLYCVPSCRGQGQIFPLLQSLQCEHIAPNEQIYNMASRARPVLRARDAEGLRINVHISAQARYIIGKIAYL